MRIVDRGRQPALEMLQEEVALLRRLDSGQGEETLLVWEAESPCLVLPRSGAAESHLWVPECKRRGAPIYRRESGGGAVALGPGCLNYALALSLRRRPELTDVAESYRLLLGLLAEALGSPRIRVEGLDLAVDSRKFAGHAQRRLRKALLHHGTILYAFDLDLVSATLREPRRRPAYRGARSHREFLTNLPTSRAVLIQACRVLAAAI